MKYKIALAQAFSSIDANVNQTKLNQIVEQAVANDAKLVVFPEMFMSNIDSKVSLAVANQHAESFDGPFVTNAKRAAANNQVLLIFGMRETNNDPKDDRVYNTIVVLDEHGKIVSTYHETHLYDAFGDKESDQIKPGNHLFQPIETPFGKLGLLFIMNCVFQKLLDTKLFTELT